MIELFSRYLPHRGCLTPLHAHITPTTVFPEKNSIRARTNQNTIDYNMSLHQLFFMSDSIKKYLVSKSGFTKSKLEAFLSAQQENNF